MKQKILVTGGLGYIGSHLITNLSKYNDIIVIDKSKNYKIVKYLRKYYKNIKIYNTLINEYSIKKIFNENEVSLVIHLASYKNNAESFIKRNLYISENFLITKYICSEMILRNCFNIIFMSSAAIYNSFNKFKLTENIKINPDSPYALSKFLNEKYLENICLYNNKFKTISLRLFNPVGQSKSLKKYLIKNNDGLFENLENSTKNMNKFYIYGKNYPTSDGTAVRDFIHILDVMEAIKKIVKDIKKFRGYNLFNLSSNNGEKVKNIVESYKNHHNKNLKVIYKKPRIGDEYLSIGNNNKIKSQIKWRPKILKDDLIKYLYF